MVNFLKMSRKIELKTFNMFFIYKEFKNFF